MTRRLILVALAGATVGVALALLAGLADAAHAASPSPSPTPSPTVAVQPPESVDCPPGTVPGWMDENGYASSCVSDVPYWPQDGPDYPAPAPSPAPTTTAPDAPAPAPVVAAPGYTG